MAAGIGLALHAPRGFEAGMVQYPTGAERSGTPRNFFARVFFLSEELSRQIRFEPISAVGWRDALMALR